MKGAVVIAIALVCGGLAAHLLLADPGYVAIRLGRTLFETTLPVFLLVLGGLYLLIRSITQAFTSRRRLALLCIGSSEGSRRPHPIRAGDRQSRG